MAHKYSNFNTAYVALTQAQLEAYEDHNYFDQYWMASRAHYSAGEALPAIYDLQVAVGYLMDIVQDYFNVHNSDVQQSLLCECIYWASKEPTAPTEYQLTMLKLIAAMSVAMPNEIMTFICLTDAYHAALWDRPYNPEYFATMVRAFKSWQ